MITRVRVVAPAFVAVGLALAGCASDPGSTPASASPTTTGAASSATVARSSSSAVSGSIVVYAAASLTESFTTLGKQYESGHPGTTITFDFEGSSALAAKINNGDDADVFASASTKNMTAVVSAGNAASPTTFAKNTMEIAVPPDNPAKVTQLSDLAKSGVQVALCQADVPCGATARMVFAKARITVKPVTEDADVKSTLAKVESGDVDAAVVYVTDVLAAGGRVRGIVIPADVNASTSYPIAPLTKGKNPSLAQDFVDYVLSPAGQAVLTHGGFGKP